MNITTKELQTRLTIMMNDFHQFLVSKDIHYFLYCGSLLGAVRHGGFIPWDDDMDIGMFRDDFNKLLEIESELPKPYKLRYRSLSDTDSLYPYTFAKIEDTSTILVEKNIQHLGIRSGLYIDIFIFDGTPDNKLLRYIHNIKYTFWCGVRNLVLIDKNKKRDFFKQIPVVIAQKLFTLEKTMNKLMSLAQKYPISECKNVTVYTRKVNPPFIKSSLQQGGLLGFGEYNFYGVQDNDYLLKVEYGDYMKLPPEEKRVAHHEYELTIK